MCNTAYIWFYIKMSGIFTYVSPIQNGEDIANKNFKSVFVNGYIHILKRFLLKWYSMKDWVSVIKTKWSIRAWYISLLDGQGQANQPVGQVDFSKVSSQFYKPILPNLIFFDIGI